MSESTGNSVDTKPGSHDAYSLIEFPHGDFDNYYYDRQIWMAVVHVRFQYSACLIFRI